MTALSSFEIATIAGTFFIAGTVKGVTGMGLPTVSMGLLSAIIAPSAAVSLLIVPSFVTNVWQLFAGPSLRLAAGRLWPMMLGIVAGTLASAGIIAKGDPGWTTMALGAAIALYASMGLLNLHWLVPPRSERILTPFAGLATGLVSGGTGVFVIPAVPYIQSLGLERDDLIQALGLAFAVATIALALGLAINGAFRGSDIGASALAVVPALLGMEAGQRLRRRIGLAAFRRWFSICLLVLGLELLLRPFV